MKNDAAYLQQIEVSVELCTFSILQPFELSCDEHENVLQTRKNNKRVSPNKWQQVAKVRWNENTNEFIREVQHGDVINSE